MNEIKSLITADDIITIMADLGVEPVQENRQYLLFPSICHHKDIVGHKPKLYYYFDRCLFICYSCGLQTDIFGLIQKMKNVNFVSTVEYVCSICGITQSATKKRNVDDWQKDLKKFLPNYESEPEPLTIYDDDILSICGGFHKDWIDYGISMETMQKFKIGFYERLNQIVIPVYNENDLVGIRIRALNEWDKSRGKYRPMQSLNRDVYKFPTNAIFYGWKENKDAIQKSKTVWLVEGEKTVLKFDSWGIDVALAVFGSKISKTQIDRLLTAGVNRIVLMFDSDYHTIGDDDYKQWEIKMQKIIAKLKPYFQVEILYNNLGYDAYKYSPTDYTKEQFVKLYESRKIIK